MTDVETADVLVVGDANVDLVLRGDVVPRFGQAEQLLDSADLVLGGSAGIVAHGLARLGVSVDLVAAIGNDAFGEFTRSRLADVGVGLDQLILDPAEGTGLSVILSAPSNRAILTHTGAMTRLTADQVRAALRRRRYRHVHFASYFLLPRLYEQLPALLAEPGEPAPTVSLDTNWDPAVRWAGLSAVLPLVDVFLPNLQELRGVGATLGLAGPIADDAAADLTTEADRTLARAIARLGPTVVVKAGAEGGWSMQADGSTASALALPLDPVDTTGAGDSFDAGYLAARLAGVPGEPERLRWAAVAGSLSTRSGGGTAAQATRAELKRALADSTTR